MKIIFKLTSIIIIQTLLISSAAFAGGVKVQTVCLSPHLNITSSNCQDIFLIEPIVAALKRHRGQVYWAAKSLGISPSEILRLIPTKRIEAIQRIEDEKIEERKKIITALKKNKGNVAKTARKLGISRTKIEHLVSADMRSSIRLNNKTDEKEKLIELIRKYCLQEGWSVKVAEELGARGKPISETALYERMKKYGIKGRQIRRQLELHALMETKGNVTKATEKLGIPRNRFWKYKKEAEKLRQELRQKEYLKRILLLFGTLEEARGNRKLMQKELGITKRMLIFHLKKYGELYFPALITERLKLTDGVLNNFKEKGEALKTQDIDSLREFFYEVGLMIEDYYNWIGLWEEELQLRFLSSDMLELLRKYRALLIKAENNFLNTPRGRRSDMLETIDKNSKLINTFYRKNEDSISKVYREHDFEKLLLKEKIITALKKNAGYIPWASKFSWISPRKIHALITKDELAAIKKKADKKERIRVLEELKKTGGNVTQTSQNLGMDREKIRRLVGMKERQAIRQKKDEQEKQELIRALKKYCLHRGAIEKAAEELGIVKGTLRERMLKYDVRVIDLRREMELKALIQAKGNARIAAEILGVSRNRFYHHHREEWLRLQKQPVIFIEQAI